MPSERKDILDAVAALRPETVTTADLLRAIEINDGISRAIITADKEHNAKFGVGQL